MVPAVPFSVEHEFLDEFPVIRVAGAGADVVIAPRGATLLSWSVVVGGERIDLSDGYLSGAELRAQNGVRNGVMAPFVNRIGDARYTFAGTEHDLRPGATTPAERLVYHGILRERDFEIAGIATDADSATVVFVNRDLRPGAVPGYPFAVDVSVEYRITARGITLTIRGENVGAGAVPFASGWHPYFRLGDAPLDRLELTIPADSRVLTDERLIPLPGDDAIIPIDGGGLDFRRPRAIGDAVFDACFTNLTMDASGRAHTLLHDPHRGIGLDVWQTGGSMHVFTGHTLRREPRTSIALEPVQVLTDAFNRPELVANVTLEPGGHRTFTFGATVLTRSDGIT